MSPIAEVTENDRFLKSRSGRTGSAARRSARRKPTREMIAMITIAITAGELHESFDPPTSATSTMALSRTARSAEPR